MKKIIATIILLSQLSWTFGLGFSVNSTNYNCSSNQPMSMVVKVCGFSDLIRIVQSSFIDTLVKVVELSCMLPQLPGPSGTQKKQPVKNAEQQNPMCGVWSSESGVRSNGQCKVKSAKCKVKVKTLLDTFLPFYLSTFLPHSSSVVACYPSLITCCCPLGSRFTVFPYYLLLITYYCLHAARGDVADSVIGFGSALAEHTALVGHGNNSMNPARVFLLTAVISK